MKLEFNRVCVVGLGYIGLPTAAILASRGVEVIGLEINSHVVETINKGDIHIVEPGLDVVVRTAVMSKKLRATKTPETADAYLIAVPTPFKGDHVPDVSYVESASKALAPVLKKGDLIVLESTSPVGTTDLMAQWLKKERPDLIFASEGSEQCDVYLAYCPERVLPGHVLRELIENDRVIGGVNSVSAERAQKLYKIFVEGDCIVTNARTAEMVKLTENSFRDVNIAFANELSLLCDKFNISVWELIQLANRHPRVKILQPGPGVGGHCISVDPWFLVHQAPDEARLIHAARKVNDSKPHFVLEKVEAVSEKFKNPTVAFFGLAFKANIDDLRESPSLDIVEHFSSRRGRSVMAVEPYIDSLPKKLEESGVQLVDLETAIQNADVLVLLVDHDQFKRVDKKKFEGKAVIDTRGLWR
ncbi:UDP-N-acetyl-D-mannosamine dehydrogenase [Bdellovibrio bacteriovorus]|uniref:UDP-N-acetyl-D-mannosamine dehydrogenase n=1 Tax=Bdellovibrio bacteriovorus TaxID=959 RepID=UPI0035A8F84B